MTLSDYLTRWNSFSASWVDRPQDWEWRAPGGERQGFDMGTLAHDDNDVGRTNLLWLAMDMAAPPRHYDARSNGLYVVLIMHGTYMRLDGLPLFDQAGCLTLGQFRSLCETAELAGPIHVSGILPLLKLLAGRRLEDAIS